MAVPDCPFRSTKPDCGIIDSLLVKDTEREGCFVSRALAFPVFPDISLPSLRSTFASNLISQISLRSHQTQPPGTVLLEDRPWVSYHTFLITKRYPRDKEAFCGVWAGFESTGKPPREYLPQEFHQSSSFFQILQRWSRSLQKG